MFHQFAHDGAVWTWTSWFSSNTLGREFVLIPGALSSAGGAGTQSFSRTTNKTAGSSACFCHLQTTQQRSVKVLPCVKPSLNKRIKSPIFSQALGLLWWGLCLLPWTLIHPYPVDCLNIPSSLVSLYLCNYYCWLGCPALISSALTAPWTNHIWERYLGTARHRLLPSAAHSSSSLGPPSSVTYGWMDFGGISGCGTFFVAQSLGRVHLQTEAPYGSSGFESCGLFHTTCYILTTGTTRWAHSQWLTRHRWAWVYLISNTNSLTLFWVSQHKPEKNTKQVLLSITEEETEAPKDRPTSSSPSGW